MRQLMLAIAMLLLIPMVACSDRGGTDEPSDSDAGEGRDSEVDSTQQDSSPSDTPQLETADGDLVTGPSGFVEYDENLSLRTADAVSPSVDSSQVLGSLIGFGFIYLCLLAVWLYVLDQKIRHGPGGDEPPPPYDDDGVMAAAASRADHSESLTGSEGTP